MKDSGKMTKQIIRVGIAGFGYSARVFHVPFLSVYPQFQLRKVFERHTHYAQEQYKDVETVQDFTALLTPEIDLVIITTPNLTHFEFTKQALLANKHVIVEKPLTVTVAQAEELAQLAKENNVILSIYQNRRWDNGALTVKKIIQEQLLGEIVDYEIRIDRYTNVKNPKAWKETGEQGTGLVYDLGVHLIDHVVELFGQPTALYADIRYQHPEAISDDNFRITFYYPNKNIVMSASKYSRENAPHIILQGTLGSYIKQNVDNQEALLVSGVSPVGNWNVESQDHWGILHTEIDNNIIRKPFETVTGNYQAYYDNIYAAITQNKPLAVSVEQAIVVLSLIEKSFLSAKLGQKIFIIN